MRSMTAAAMASTRANEGGEAGERLWLERLRLSDFRSYASLTLLLDARPVVLTGPNGAGKTNLLEAISLLAPGRGLRQCPFAALTRTGAAGGWAVAARVHGPAGPVELGTGLSQEPRAEAGGGRVARVDGRPARGSGALGAHVRIVWLTPAMDGLFTGPVGERRRFLDRLVQSLDPGFGSLAARFERAMRQRNRLFETGRAAPSQFEGLEWQMAETGVAIAAARLTAVARLAACIEARRERDPASPFPWATLAVDGALERQLQAQPAVEVEDAYRARLADGRERDRAAKRALSGPHRSDLIVGHGPKRLAAGTCSTGEQKALLLGLVLAHCELVKADLGGWAPLLLLDEVAAHLDAARREALLREIACLGAQAWLTGTEGAAFAALAGHAQFLGVDDGSIRAANKVSV